jgi:D-glycero-D-manno-heptose 1,7-bisphosphate phosphatase
MATRLIILDRDGVINHDSHAFIKSPSEWLPIDGSLDAISLLCRNGFTVAVASNQSGIGRRLFDKSALDAIHRKMRRAATKAGGHIDRISVCPHVPEDACDCRKPAPGLLVRLGRHCGVPLAGVPVVGDDERDLRAAEAVAARPILVLTGKGRLTLAGREKRGLPTECYPNLMAVVAVLVGERLQGLR